MLADGSDSKIDPSKGSREPYLVLDFDLSNKQVSEISLGPFAQYPQLCVVYTAKGSGFYHLSLLVQAAS